MRQVLLLEKMIENGYEPDVVDSFNRNLLHREISMIDTNPDLVDFLIKEGVDPLSENNAGWSALAYALSVGDKPAIYAIINSGIDFQQAQSLWSPMIHSWKESGMEEIAAQLLLLGVPINRPTEYPLHFAVRQASFEAFQWLLENGSDPNRLDYNGVLPEWYTRY
jgi:ankyrin repeat protein